VEDFAGAVGQIIVFWVDEVAEEDCGAMCVRVGEGCAVVAVAERVKERFEFVGSSLDGIVCRSRSGAAFPAIFGNEGSLDSPYWCIVGHSSLPSGGEI